MAVNFKTPIVLMADDDEDDCLLVETALRESSDAERVHLVFARDGIELLGYLQVCSGAAMPCPRLILLDLNMPKMDGREALKKIKENVRLRSIPIVVLTTSRNDRDIELCYELGASSYIVKPADFESLAAAVGSVIDYWFSVVRLPCSGICVK